MSPGDSEGRPGEKAAATNELDLVGIVAPGTDIPPCRCQRHLCDHPGTCQVHGPLHAMVCLGGERHVA